VATTSHGGPAGDSADVEARGTLASTIVSMAEIDSAMRTS
jgi:hypothetical protein